MMMGLLYWSNKQRNTYTPTKSHKICLHIGLVRNHPFHDFLLPFGCHFRRLNNNFFSSFIKLEEMEAKDQKVLYWPIFFPPMLIYYTNVAKPLYCFTFSGFSVSYINAYFHLFKQLKGGSTLESKDQKFQQFVNIKIRN
jgi:hypothetical protein